jgi:hypothetical protein
MLRIQIVGYLLAVVAGLLVIQAFTLSESFFFPDTSHSIEYADMNYIAATSSIGKLLYTGLSWWVGSLTCGLVLGLITGRKTYTLSLLSGLLYITGAIVTLFLYDYPLWFKLANLAAIMPLHLVGQIVGGRKPVRIPVLLKRTAT